ncbi:hypothetical protein ID866_5050 [Astraeus odoratus]|nr:hypothetical protein ID866_5050 [Astraeus odoratus]
MSSLRRRFQSTHDDACFTIMALMPTLAAQILADMDVESLTDELQSLSVSSGVRSPSRPPLPPHAKSPQSASETSSTSDVQSEAGTTSSCSGSVYEGERASGLGSGSWVEQMSASESSQGQRDSFVSLGGQLSDSVLSTSSSLSCDGQRALSDAGSTSSSKKRKAQLWKEVKNLTLTRTLTTLYTTTLLSLLTATQLSLLARSRYISSVRASERAERARDKVPQFSLTGILAREAIARVVDVEALYPKWLLTEEDDLEEDPADEVSDITEMRYLTLSWWILHVGWKDVAVRVRGAVENVFDRLTSLATACHFERNFHVRNFTPSYWTCGDMWSSTVRRSLVMPGGPPVYYRSLRDRFTLYMTLLLSRFLSSLLPPTPETTAHVLAQGGALPIPTPGVHRECTNGHEKDLSRRADSAQTQILDGSSPATAIDITSLDHGVTSPSALPTRTAVSQLSHINPSSAQRESALLSSLESDPRFMSLLSEARAYLSGPDFAYALTCALDRATGVLMDGLRSRVFVDTGNAVNPSEGDGNGQREGDQQQSSETFGTEAPKEEELSIRLVGLLPGLARWSQLALNATPNELVDNIMAVREVSALEAIVISDYQDRYPPIA